MPQGRNILAFLKSGRIGELGTLQPHSFGGKAHYQLKKTPIWPRDTQFGTLQGDPIGARADNAGGKGCRNPTLRHAKLLRHGG